MGIWVVKLSGGSVFRNHWNQHVAIFPNRPAGFLLPPGAEGVHLARRREEEMRGPEGSLWVLEKDNGVLWDSEYDSVFESPGPAETVRFRLAFEKDVIVTPVRYDVCQGCAECRLEPA